MNKLEQEKKDYLVKKKEEALAKAPPKIERLSEIEVYMLKNGNREQRICGAKREELPEEYACMTPAGFNTGHVGIGYCVAHDPDKNLDVKYWRKLNSSLKIPRDIQELYERTSTIGKSELFSLGNVMKRTMVLYWNILNHPEGRDKDTDEKILTLRQSQELRYLDSLCMQIIECERRSVGEGRLKVATIDHFLQGIFDVITSSLPRTQGRLVLNRIMKITYTEHDEGKIQGDIGGLEKKVVEVEMKYEENENKEIITEVEVVNE